jgi:hypothetical protein
MKSFFKKENKLVERYKQAKFPIFDNEHGSFPD